MAVKKLFDVLTNAADKKMRGELVSPSQKGK